MSLHKFPAKSGFAKFDRGWLLHEDSPFSGKHHRKHYLVWQHLCLFSTYQPMDGLGKGEFKTTTRELSDYCSQGQTAIRNALAFLVSHGLIEILSTTRQIHTRITHYDDIENMLVFMGKCKPTNPGCSIDTILNHSESQTKEPVSESRVLNSILGCSKGAQTKQDLNQCNDGENVGKKNAGCSKGAQKTPLLKEYNKETDINNYSVKSDGAVPPSIAYRRKAGGDLVSDFDHEIAKTWADRMKAADKERAATSGKPIRERKPPLAKWAETICKMRTIDQVSEDDIRLILETRFADEFYKTTDMCPGNLRSKAQNGHPKWLNLLTKGQRTQKEENAQRSLKSPLKRRPAKVHTLEDILS